MAISIKNVIVLGLLALSSTGVHGHSDHHHHNEDEEIVLTQSKKEELLMKWEQEV